MKTGLKFIGAMVLFAVTLVACETAPVKPQKTSLEIQAIQSRTFETSKLVAFASVISVFQDLGYIVNGADRATGFITATSAGAAKYDWFLTGNKYNSKTKATAFIEQLRPKKTKIRLNFVVNSSVSSIYGQKSESSKIIDDPKVYQNAFSKIGDAIFIRSGS